MSPTSGLTEHQRGVDLSTLGCNMRGVLQPTAEQVLSPEFYHRLKSALSVAGTEPELPRDITVEREWRNANGVDGQLLSYSSPIGGPKIEAYVLRPSNITRPLPAVMALHCHGNFKLLGKEKIADDNLSVRAEIARYRANGYGGRAFANELARRGYVVLVPDTFLWGSRQIDHESIPVFFGDVGKYVGQHERFASKLPEAHNSDVLAQELARDNAFEPLVESLLRIKNTSLAGVVNLEDRVSVRVLQSLGGVAHPETIGAIGLSGGGNRTGLLLATEDAVRVGVIAGMMCTYSALCESGQWWKHSTLFYPPNIPGQPSWEWPDIVARGASYKSVCCLNNRQDPLFVRAGQEAAHERLREIYRAARREREYVGLDFDGHHKFDIEMQERAFSFLAEKLAAGASVELEELNPQRVCYNYDI
jgi:dienelactone hydrolase